MFGAQKAASDMVETPSDEVGRASEGQGLSIESKGEFFCRHSEDLSIPIELITHRVVPFKKISGSRKVAEMVQACFGLLVFTKGGN